MDEIESKSSESGSIGSGSSSSDEEVSNNRRPPIPNNDAETNRKQIKGKQRKNAADLPKAKATPRNTRFQKKQSLLPESENDVSFQGPPDNLQYDSESERNQVRENLRRNAADLPNKFAKTTRIQKKRSVLAESEADISFQRPPDSLQYDTESERNEVRENQRNNPADLPNKFARNTRLQKKRSLLAESEVDISFQRPPDSLQYDTESERNEVRKNQKKNAADLPNKFARNTRLQKKQSLLADSQMDVSFQRPRDSLQYDTESERNEVRKNQKKNAADLPNKFAKTTRLQKKRSLLTDSDTDISIQCFPDGMHCDAESASSEVRKRQRMNAANLSYTFANELRNNRPVRTYNNKRMAKNGTEDSTKTKSQPFQTSTPLLNTSSTRPSLFSPVMTPVMSQGSSNSRPRELYFTIARKKIDPKHSHVEETPISKSMSRSNAISTDGVSKRSSGPSGSRLSFLASINDNFENVNNVETDDVSDEDLNDVEEDNGRNKQTDVDITNDIEKVGLRGRGKHFKEQSAVTVNNKGKDNNQKNSHVKETPISKSMSRSNAISTDGVSKHSSGSSGSRRSFLAPINDNFENVNNVETDDVSDEDLNDVEEYNGRNKQTDVDITNDIEKVGLRGRGKHFKEQSSVTVNDKDKDNNQKDSHVKETPISKSMSRSNAISTDGVSKRSSSSSGSRLSFLASINYNFENVNNVETDDVSDEDLNDVEEDNGRNKQTDVDITNDIEKVGLRGRGKHFKEQSAVTVNDKDKDNNQKDSHVKETPISKSMSRSNTISTDGLSKRPSGSRLSVLASFNNNFDNVNDAESVDIENESDENLNDVEEDDGRNEQIDIDTTNENCNNNQVGKIGLRGREKQLKEQSAVTVNSTGKDNNQTDSHVMETSISKSLNSNTFYNPGLSKRPSGSRSRISLLASFNNNFENVFEDSSSQKSKEATSHSRVSEASNIIAKEAEASKTTEVIPSEKKTRKRKSIVMPVKAKSKLSHKDIQNLKSHISSVISSADKPIDVDITNESYNDVEKIGLRGRGTQFKEQSAVPVNDEGKDNNQKDSHVVETSISKSLNSDTFCNPGVSKRPSGSRSRLSVLASFNNNFENLFEDSSSQKSKETTSKSRVSEASNIIAKEVEVSKTIEVIPREKKTRKRKSIVMPMKAKSKLSHKAIKNLKSHISSVVSSPDVGHSPEVVFTKPLRRKFSGMPSSQQHQYQSQKSISTDSNAYSVYGGLLSQHFSSENGSQSHLQSLTSGSQRVFPRTNLSGEIEKPQIPEELEKEKEINNIEKSIALFAKHSEGVEPHVIRIKTKRPELIATSNQDPKIFEADNVSDENVNDAEADDVSDNDVNGVEADDVSNDNVNDAEADDVSDVDGNVAEADDVSDEDVSDENSNDVEADDVSDEDVSDEDISDVEAGDVSNENANDVEADDVSDENANDVSDEDASDVEAGDVSNENANDVEADDVSDKNSNDVEADDVSDEDVNDAETDDVSDDDVNDAETDDVNDQNVSNVEADDVSDDNVNDVEADDVSDENVNDAEADDVSDNDVNGVEADDVSNDNVNDAEADDVSDDDVNDAETDDVNDQNVSNVEADDVSDEDANDVEADDVNDQNVSNVGADDVSDEDVNDIEADDVSDESANDVVEADDVSVENVSNAKSGRGEECYNVVADGLSNEDGNDVEQIRSRGKDKSSVTVKLNDKGRKSGITNQISKRNSRPPKDSSKVKVTKTNIKKRDSWNPDCSFMTKHGGDVLYNFDLLDKDVLQELINEVGIQNEVSSENFEALLESMNNYIETLMDRLCDETPQCMYYGVFTFQAILEAMINERLAPKTSNSQTFVQMMKEYMPKEGFLRSAGYLYPSRNSKSPDTLDFFSKMSTFRKTRKQK